jgi:murein DD-endopeptidase MepM/ murein hydrolase activator NlpD
MASLLGADNPSDGLSALLASTQLENPPVPQTGPSLPSFSARRFLSLPDSLGAVPSAPPLSQAGPALADLLELTRGPGDPEQVAPDVPGPPPRTKAAPTAPKVPRGHGYPLGKHGKVIGTPYSGTHTLCDWQSDNAIDIAVPIGTPVYATETGTITKTRIKSSLAGRFGGSQVTLGSRHNGFFYAHLKRVVVKSGQRVKKGQLIGYSGAANGVQHLHFGIEHGNPLHRYG